MSHRPSGPALAVTAGIAALFIVGLTQPAIAQPTTEVVQISLDEETGELRAAPDVVTVRPGDRVEWQSRVKAWAVSVESAEPFGQQVRERGIRGRAGQRRGAVVAASARAGRYKYTIAVWDGEEVKILDPEIVIGPG